MHVRYRNSEGRVLVPNEFSREEPSKVLGRICNHRVD